MTNSYRTINDKAQAEIVVKKSRFIANVCPIASEEEALNFIANIKKQYYDARHNCFAYIVGSNVPIIRCSDDGEPSGTAGKPILDVLTGENLENVVVVVTRYFGGTLLGTGGLVRAYSSATKEGIISAKIVEMNTFLKIFITVDYSLIGKIQYEISNSNSILIDTDYTDNVKFSVYVKLDDVDEFILHMINITNNSAKIVKENQYILKIIDGNVSIE